MLKTLVRLFTSKPFVPPTQQQLDYAELCGVSVSSDMDRDGVSAAIDAAFEADPKLKYKVNARRKRKEKEAQEAVDSMPSGEKRALKKWSDAAQEHDHFLVVYKSKRKTVVDILECDDARVKSGDILISFLAPRVEEVVVGSDGSKDIREKELCWDEPVKLLASQILESRKIEIYDDQVRKYRSTINRKVKQLGG